MSHSSQTAGAESSMLDLFDIWTNQGKVEPTFIIREPVEGLAAELRKRKWKYFSLPYNYWSTRAPAKNAEDITRIASINTKAVLEIENIIDKVKPDVVMTNAIPAPWAALAAYYKRIPHVWFVREYGDLDHGHTFEEGRKKTLEDIDSLSGLVVVNSNTLGAHVGRYIDTDKIATLYTPFDLKAIAKRAKAKVPTPFKEPGSLKAVITGSIAPSKGQAEAVEAVAKLNKEGISTELCIIGSPKTEAYGNSLAKIIDEYGLGEKVHMVGQQANPLAFLSLADVGITASRREAFGRITFEYIATGKPVVGANSGATPEMVEQGKNGFLYKQGDASSLAASLKRYAKNRRLLTEHGQAAKQKAELMMHSEHNSQALFEKVQKVARTSSSYRPIYFTHRWLEYLNIAQEDHTAKARTLSGKIKEEEMRNKHLAEQQVRALERSKKLEKTIGGLENELQGIRTSISWRITRPLRVASYSLKRVFDRTKK